VIKTAPSVARIGAMVVFALSCFCILLWLWLTFGGPVPLKPKGYEVEVAFDEAVQLTSDLDVRSAGITIGTISGTKSEPETGRTLVTLEIDEKFAPIDRDARAILRWKTLLAETFVEIAPGKAGGPTVPDGGRLDDGHVQDTVELDEVFASYDPRTRQAFRQWQQELSVAVGRRGEDLNNALGQFPDFTSEATGLLDVLNRHEREVRGLVRDSGEVYSALAQDEQQLENLIRNSDALFEQTSQEREALFEAFQIFPTFLEESRQTAIRLEDFSRDTQPLIEDLRPVTRELQPTIRAVRLLAPDLNRFFRNFDDQIRVSKRGLPALREILRETRPLFAALGPFLQELNPITEFFELHQHLVADFLGNAASAMADTVPSAQAGETGHYLRQISVTGSESLGIHRTRLSSNRGNSYLPPMPLSRRNVEFNIFGNFDCKPSKGEGNAKNPPEGWSGPSCLVAPATLWAGGQEGQFMRVDPNDYSR
jgi:phospholipid/cholesterol/gamma-HCH transport system substrate-binding protein